MPSKDIFEEERSLVSEAEKSGLTRKQAIELGRRLGAQEADRRRETGPDREQRIRRAAAYAAWDYDGRPASSKPQREELGVAGEELTASLERAVSKQK